MCSPLYSTIGWLLERTEQIAASVGCPATQGERRIVKDNLKKTSAFNKFRNPEAGDEHPVRQEMRKRTGG
jgi:hypothetical protein